MSLGLLPPRAPVRCTGLTASWCPIHGDCLCPRAADGEPIPYGVEWDGVVGWDLSYPGCPLHHIDSPHEV